MYSFDHFTNETKELASDLRRKHGQPVERASDRRHEPIPSPFILVNNSNLQEILRALRAHTTEVDKTLSAIFRHDRHRRKATKNQPTTVYTSTQNSEYACSTCAALVLPTRKRKCARVVRRRRMDTAWHYQRARLGARLDMSALTIRERGRAMLRSCGL